MKRYTLNLRNEILSTSNIRTAFLMALLFIMSTMTVMAQVSFKDYSSNISNSGTNTVTVPKVTGVATGDFLLMSFAYEKGSSVNLNVSTNGFQAKGWTLIRSANRSNNVGIATFYRFATADDVGGNDYTFTVDDDPKWSIAIARLTGVNTTTPIQTSAGASGSVPSDPNTLNVTAPSITTTVDNTFIAAFFTNKKNATYSQSFGVERFDVPNNSQGLPSNMMATYTQASKGATGSKVAVASVEDDWAAMQVALNAAPAPTLTSISPTSGTQGQSVSVTLTGTNFVSGATVNISGSDVTASSVTVVSATSITATFNIGASAATGARDVTVTSGGVTTAKQTFTVNAFTPAPTLTSISPTSGAQDATVNVTLTGTNFVDPASITVSSTGVTVSNVTVVNATTITATFTIASNAPTNSRDVRVTTPGGNTTTVAFLVTPKVDPPTNLSYGATEFSFTYGTAITSLSPTNGGGTVSGYTISPDLPAGLSFSTSTGQISGNPEVTSAETSYVVTASNSAGSTEVTLTIAVGKRSITVTPNPNQSKVYGETDPTLAYTSSANGLAFNDTFDGKLTRMAGEDVGEYAIVIGNLKIIKGSAPGKVAENEIMIPATIDVTAYYTITLADESFEITQKDLTISGMVSANDKVYDGTTDASLDISGASLVGVKTGDAVSLATPVGTFANADAGENISVTPSLTLSGEDAGNYSFTQPTGLTADITPAPVIILPDEGQSKIVGEDDPELTYTTRSGIPLIAKISGSGYQISGNLGREDGNEVGEYDFTLGTLELDTDNYELLLDENAPTFSILPATTEITLDEEADTEFDYNSTPQGLNNQITVKGSKATPVFTYTGRNGTIYGPSSTPPTDVGNYSVTVTVAADDSFGGAEAGPFNFEILPKTITIGGSFTAANKMFDGNTSASFLSNQLNLSGVETTDQSGVNLSNVSLAFDNAFINTPQTVRIVSANLTGTRAGQYLLSLEEAPTATASITFVYYDVTVKVYEDQNANGAMDAGDAGLSGRTVTLSKGAFSVNGQTNAQGEVSFELENAEAGQYTLTVTEPTGWVNVSASKTINLNSSQTEQSASFGQYRPAEVSGIAFRDRNNNDIFDDGDELYSGLSIRLTTPEGNLLQVQSGSDGRYSITGLRPSERVLSAVNPSETLIVSFPYAPSEYQLSLSSGDALEDFNFALTEPAVVFGTLSFENITLSTTTMQSVVVRGYRTGPSPTKVAFPLTMTNNQEEIPVFSGQPNGDGSFVFLGVKPGQYRIELSLPEVLRDVKPTPMMVTVKKDEPTDLNLVVRVEENQEEELVASSSLRGFIYADVNGNALWDGTNATLLRDITVYLEGTTIRGEEVKRTTKTSMKGEYHFTELKPGKYTVQLSSDVNYRVTIPGNNQHMIELDRFEDLGKSPFEEVQAGEPEYLDKTPIGFTLYMDWDRDGKLDERIVMSGRFEVELAGTTLDVTRPLRNIRLQANGKLVDGRPITVVFPSVYSARGTFSSMDQGFDVKLQTGITIAVGSDVFYSDDRLNFTTKAESWPMRRTYLVADHFQKGLLMRDPFGRPISNVMFVSMTPLYGYDFGIENADYGDAPVSYGTIKVLANDKTGEPLNGCINYPNDGARHVVPMQGAAAIYLGSGVSADRDGKPSVKADADSDDGVMMDGLVQLGTALKMQIKVVGRGYLNAWADWNGNGVFDSGEQIITDLMPELNQTMMDLSVNVPATAVADTSYIRFRYSSVKGLEPRGWAKDGEVEDYAVVLTGDVVAKQAEDEGDGQGGAQAASEEEEGALPKSFRMGQNYPNPFNPTTVIPFDMAEAGMVKISVYDITGRLVKVLVNESMRAGRHVVSFDAMGIPSGVYMVRMAAGGQVFTGKLTLVK